MIVASYARYNSSFAVLIIFLIVLLIYLSYKGDTDSEITKTIIDFAGANNTENVKNIIEVFFIVIIVVLSLWWFIMLPFVKEPNSSAIEKFVNFIESIQIWQYNPIDEPTFTNSNYIKVGLSIVLFALALIGPLNIFTSSWWNVMNITQLNYDDLWKFIIMFFGIYIGISSISALCTGFKTGVCANFTSDNGFIRIIRWLCSTSWLCAFVPLNIVKWCVCFILFIVPYLLCKLYFWYINDTNVSTDNIIKRHFISTFESRIYEFPFNIFKKTNILRQMTFLFEFLTTKSENDTPGGTGESHCSADLQLFIDTYLRPDTANVKQAADLVDTIEERKSKLMRQLIYIIGMIVMIIIFVLVAIYGGYKMYGMKIGDIQLDKDINSNLTREKTSAWAIISGYFVIGILIIALIIAFYRYKTKETGGEDQFNLLEQPLDTKNDGIFMMILKYIWSTIRYIPCLIVDAIDVIRREFNITTRPVWILLIIEVIIILLAWLIPFLMNKIGTASDSQIVAGSVPLNQERDTGLKTDSPEVAIFNNTGKDRSDSDNAANCPPEEKKRYSYSVSGWFWINGGANTEDKDLMILNFGNVPRITYNPASTNFKVECDQILPNGETTERDFTSGNVDANSGVKPAIVYQSLEISNIDKKSTDYKEYEMINAIQVQKLIQLQKWNYIVINYDGKTMDVFLNSELIGKSGFIMPNIRSDIIKTGQKDGLSGNICNVVCAHEPMTTEKMRWTYNTLKMLDPPIIGADSVVDDINNLRNTEYTSRYFNQGQVNERK